MAYAMDIFGSETKQNLDLIRTVRNAFAHAKIPIKFDTTLIEEACSRLVVPKSLPPTIVRGSLNHLKGRKRFQEVCNTTAHNLNIYARAPASAQLKISVDDPLPRLPGNPEIYAKRPALP